MSGLCLVRVVSCPGCVCPGYVRVRVMSVSGLCLCPGYVCVQVMSCLGCVCPGYVLYRLCRTVLFPSTWNCQFSSHRGLLHQKTECNFTKSVLGMSLYSLARQYNNTERHWEKFTMHSQALQAMPGLKHTQRRREKKMGETRKKKENNDGNSGF